MRKILFLCLGISCGLCNTSINAASDGPSEYLKGIKTITYYIAIENTVGGDGCKVDQQNLETSIRFTANQSATLKFENFKENAERGKELSARYLSLSQQKANPAEIGAARLASHQHTFMPSLIFNLTPMQVSDACAATIGASLSAHVETTRLISTQIEMYQPTVELWSFAFYFVNPQRTFSDRAVGAADQILKKLVNDWTASQ